MVCEPQQRLKTAASIIQHPWFADIEWHAVHRLPSPLQEDTEQYAQKHFAHLTLESPSSSAGPTGAAGDSTGTPFASGKQCGPASGNAGWCRPRGPAAPTDGHEPMPTGSRLAPPTAGAGTSRLGGRPIAGSGCCTSSCSYAVTEHDLFFSRYAFSRKAVDTVPTFGKVLQRTAEKYPIVAPPCCLNTSFSTCRDPNNNTISTSTPPLSDSLQSFNCTSSGFGPSPSCSCECSPPPSTSSSSSCGADCCTRLSKRSPPLLREPERLVPAVSEDTTLPASGEAATIVPGFLAKGRGPESSRARVGGTAFPTRTVSETLRVVVGVESYTVRDVPSEEAVAEAAAATAAALGKASVEACELEVPAAGAHAGTGTATTARGIGEDGSGEEHARDVAASQADTGKYSSVEIQRGAQECQTTAAAKFAESRLKNGTIPPQQAKDFSEFSGAGTHSHAIPDHQLHNEAKPAGSRINCRADATSCLPSPAPSTRASCGSPPPAPSFGQKPTQVKQALENRLLISQQYEPINEVMRQSVHMRDKQAMLANEAIADEQGSLKTKLLENSQKLAVLSSARNAPVDVEDSCLRFTQVALHSHEMHDKSTLRQTHQPVLQQNNQLLPPKTSHVLENVSVLHISGHTKVASRAEDVVRSAFHTRQKGPRLLQQGGPLPLSRCEPLPPCEITLKECGKWAHTLETACRREQALPKTVATSAENTPGSLLSELFTAPVPQAAAGNAQDVSDCCYRRTAAATRMKDVPTY